MKKSNLSSLVVAVSLLAAPLTHAATVVWGGPGAGTNAWSTNANWVGATPPLPNDDVKFFDTGASGVAVSNVNNFVDTSFTIGSLQYGNTNSSPNGNHTTLIASGATLLVTNANGLTAGTLGDLSNLVVTATIVGSGGSLVVSNPAATLIVNQGHAANANNGQRATLDMTGLDTFVANVGRIGVGTAILGGGNNVQNATGTLKLARTNSITSSFVTATITNSTSTPTNAIEIGGNNGNTGGTNFLFLGQMNTFAIDSIGVGKLKTISTMLFNPAFTNSNPTAVFRQTNGVDRVRFWTVGDMWSSGSSSSGCTGTNDFSNGTIDAMVDLMSLGRDRPGGNTGTATNLGILTFTSGIIDVNTLKVGNQDGSATGNSNPNAGFLTVNGSGATLVVNSNLILGNTTVSSTAATKTSGNLIVRNGTVKASLITVGATSTNNTIAMTNGTLILTNTAGAPGRGLTTLSITNSTLQLFVSTGGPIIVATNLVTGGITNQINLASVAVFPSYPAQITLIKYAGVIGGVGFNLGFGTAPIPASAPGAYISNNVANASVDLVLPFDPRPVIISEPSSYSGSPGDNVTFTAGISPGSVTPLSYQWYLNGSTFLTDGTTGNGSTLSGSLSTSLTISNAQIADSGNYTLVVTNIFGSATSAPPALLTISPTSIPPGLVGPSNQTVIAGNSATITASVSGAPVPTLQWFFNGAPLSDGPTGHGDSISGSATASLTVSNAQYPASQGTYSLVASNVAGVVTNSMQLTVIVPPVIPVQPQSLVVTTAQRATFSVVAAGVPAPTFQWLKNGIPISGQTSNIFTIGSSLPSDIATYSVVASNAAGSVLSSNAALIVNSPTLAPVALSPVNGATGICADTPLSITFNAAPSIGSLGKIRIFNANNPATPVDTLDMSLNLNINGHTNVQARNIGGATYNTYPVIITGNTAAIYPHLGLLASNQTYFVTVDDGVFTDNIGAYFVGITDTNAWRFTTKPVGAPAGSSSVVVAQDSSGDFATVQGAVDFLPANNTNHVLITVRSGLYTEIVFLNTKNNVTFRGQDRRQTIITYANNDSLNSGTSTRPSFRVRGNDVAFENLTITNSTPHGGTQAEALRVGDGSKRCIFFNCDLDSFQDTLLVNNDGDQLYAQNSHIQGDTDYIWGSGTIYMTNCELMAMTSGSHLTQARTSNGTNGFAFVNCRIVRAGTNVTGCDLGRDAGNSFPYGQTAYVNCSMDTNAIIPGGWINGGIADPSQLRFWEYQSTDLTGTNLIDVSSRISYSQQISGTTATNVVQNVTNWMNGWLPQLAPNILSQPTNQSVAGAASASFSVAATGIPDPSYQWQKNGANIPGATGASLVIAAAYAGDAANYSVVVSNGAGTVTSSTATLTVGNTAPTLSPIGNLTINAGVGVSITNVATDPDVPPQTITFSLLSGPTNSTLGPFSGVFSWRPSVSQGGTTNIITIQASDNGTPSLTATQSFQVIVNPVTTPTLGAGGYAGGQFSFEVDGDTGPDYMIQASTDLTNWTTILTAHSPSTPFIFVDTNASNYPVHFYRVVLGP